MLLSIWSFLWPLKFKDSHPLLFIISTSSELHGRCSALQKLTRHRIQFSHHAFPLSHHLCSHTFSGIASTCFWHLLSCSLGSSRSPICRRRETKALGRIGACGCSRGAVELFLALVLTPAPTPHPGFLWGRKGRITLEKCSESGRQAQGSPSWGE